MLLYAKQTITMILIQLLVCGALYAQSGQSESNEIDSLKAELFQIRFSQQYYQIGKICLDLGAEYFRANLDSASKYYQLSENYLLQSGDSSLLSNVHLGLGMVLKKKGQYNEALQHYFLTLQLARDNHRVLASVNNSIGSLYNKTDRLDEAIPYYQKALKHYGIIQDTERVNKTTGNLANVLTKLQLYDSAMNYYLKSYQIKLAANDSMGMATVLNNIGWAYLESNKLDKAEEYLLQALQLKKELNEKININKTMNQLGEVYLLKKEYNKAFDYLTQALEIARKNELRKDEREILINLSNYYEALGKHEEQSEILKQYITLDESLFNAEKLNTMRNMESRFKDQQITFLEKTENSLKSRVQRQGNLLFWAILAIVTLLFASTVAIVFTIKYKRSSDLNYQLKKENQHSTKNHLQTLSSLFSLQHQALENLQAKEALADSRNRVNAINLIHQLLYEKNNREQTVQFDHYLKKLTEALQSTYQSGQLEIVADIANSHHFFNADLMLNIGLLLNELVTNAVKYGTSATQTATIKIRAYIVENTTIFLEVRDNGPGLPDSDQNATSAFGMQLVNIMCQQLNAEKTLFNDQGAVFQFSIPFP